MVGGDKERIKSTILFKESFITTSPSAQPAQTPLAEIMERCLISSLSCKKKKKSPSSQPPW